MNKIIKFALSFFLILSAMNPVYANNQVFPQSDFFLYMGTIKIAEDSHIEKKVERILFNSIHIDIKNGKVAANKTIPFNLSKIPQDFSGTAGITMDGEYDKNEGQLSGSFKINMDIKSIWHGSVADLKGNWKNEITGNFFGQVVEDKVVIRFTGKNSSAGENEMADNSIKPFSLVTDYRVSTAWSLSNYKAVDPTTEATINDDFLDENGNTVDSGSRFSGINGIVEIHLPGTPEDAWTAVEMEMPIPVGARIRTKEESGAVLAFSDMSTFVLKPETQIIISKLPGKENKLGVIAGDIMLNIKKLVQDGTMEVDTLQAAGGIKGTILAVHADSEKSTFKLIEGAISVKPLTSDETFELQGGQEITVDNAGEVLIQPFDPATELDSWDKANEIDFDSLEKYLSEEPAVEPMPESAVEPAGESENKFIYIIGIAAVFLLGGLAFIKSRKK